MTPQQIELVQKSFQKVVPIASTAADLFYTRLFEIAPETRALFPADMTEQKAKLMAMLATAVTNLHQLDTILPAVKGLGPDWTPELQAAWTETYTALAGVMANA
jgi:hemoglobin-like flavoprotein